MRRLIGLVGAAILLAPVSVFAAAGWVENVKVEKIFLTKHFYAPSGNTALGDADHGGVFVEVSGSLAVTNCGETGRKRFFFNLKKPREQMWFSSLLSAYHAKSTVSIYVEDVCGAYNYPLVGEIQLK